MFIPNSCLPQQAGVTGTTAKVTCTSLGGLAFRKRGGIAEGALLGKRMGFGWVTCR